MHSTHTTRYVRLYACLTCMSIRRNWSVKIFAHRPYTKILCISLFCVLMHVLFAETYIRGRLVRIETAEKVRELLWAPPQTPRQKSSHGYASRPRGPVNFLLAQGRSLLPSEASESIMSVTGREKPPEVGRIIGACAAGKFSPLCAHASRYVESVKRRSEIRGGDVPERNILGNGRPFGMNEWAALVSLAQLQWRSARAATWLILPVVICLSQRLSHACLSTSSSRAKLRMAH